MPRLAHARELESIVREVARAVTLPRYLDSPRLTKTDGSSLTEADTQTQRALATRVQQIIEAPVLGEEMTFGQQAEIWANAHDGLWVIDPIDGTTNFANGIPMFALSVAWLSEGVTQFGVVYDPIADEAFYGARGEGAWLNGIRLPQRKPARELAQAIASADFKRLPPALAQRLALASPCFSLRSFGSSALEWCFVAAGRLDLHLHGGQMLWDYAVGRLLVEEAGGVASGLDGEALAADPLAKQGVVVGASAALHRQWLEWVSAAT
ncbi:inositol monophosphatase family protein [Niveibacterium terrae]|uniref:inositol monophosphatase family protein n=1 Tax=Niveibacterium terrae TaxID=3373598 RepID=UPI003A91F691